MGLVKGFAQRVEIPGEGQTVTIRMLNHVELEQARDAKLDKMSTRMSALKQIRQAFPTSEPTRAETEKAVEDDPLVPFDLDTLLRLGVTAWTYTESDGKAIPVDTSLFDEPTALLVGREIARFSNPGAAELGKASSSSTAT